MPERAAVRQFFTGLADPYTAEAVFDAFEDVVYFVKNDRGEYVVVNQTLADRCAAGDKARLLGKTAEQAFPPPLGRTFREQDAALVRSGRSALNQLELHLYTSGRTGWCLTNKLPLRGTGGRVVGLVGFSRDLQPPDEAADEYTEVAAAVRYAAAHIADRPTLAALGRVAGLSGYQLDHRIRRLFRLTTGQLLHKLRMDAAAERLRETADPVATVSLDCGYADQSAFARQFKATTGLAPGEYRRAFRRPG